MQKLGAGHSSEERGQGDVESLSDVGLIGCIVEFGNGVVDIDGPALGLEEHSTVPVTWVIVPWVVLGELPADLFEIIEILDPPGKPGHLHTTHSGHRTADLLEFLYYSLKIRVAGRLKIHNEGVPFGGVKRVSRFRFDVGHAELVVHEALKCCLKSSWGIILDAEHEGGDVCDFKAFLVAGKESEHFSRKHIIDPIVSGSNSIYFMCFLYNTVETVSIPDFRFYYI